MRFCHKCGKNLTDDAAFCVNCGSRVQEPNTQEQVSPCETPAPPPVQQPYQQNYQQPYQQGYQQPYQQNYQQPYQQGYQQPYQQFNSVVDRESSSTANCALLFAFLIPLVGFIVGIVGLSKYKTPSFRNKCIAAIVVSIVVWVIGFISLFAIYSMW